MDVRQIKYILKRYNIEISDNYTINENGKLDVQGNVIIKYENLTYIPLKFGRVNGDFKCNNLKLKSLKGAPEYVSHDFQCSGNELLSLKHGPKYVGGTYDCSQNKLSNLIGCATKIGRGLICKMNKLKSLSGCPNEIYGRLHCSYNLLNNFEGGPKKMEGEIYATSNFLNNLKGLPKDFDGKIFIDPSARSINTTFDHKSMKLELRLQSKFGHNFMPSQILDYHRFLDIIIKYQHYYEIWEDSDDLHVANFQILLEDIIGGLL